MAGNRKKAEKLILDTVRALEQGDDNYNLYKALFAEMNDDEFDAYIEAIDKGETYISLIIPNGTDNPLSLANNIKVGESLGVKYFQRIVQTDPATGEETLSVAEYLIIHLPTNRQIQHLVKKASIPDSIKVVDNLTGAVTGESKGAKVSLPELLALESRGLDESIIEMIKIRGGDTEAYQDMIRQIKETGTFKVSTALEKDTTVTATQTLKSLLTALHYKNTI